MKTKIKTNFIGQFARRAVCWLPALLLGGVASAATYTWTGAGFLGDQDYLWSNDFNWQGNVGPAPGEANVTLVFPNNASPKVTTNDLVGLTVASIQFQGTNYVVHGKPAGNTLGLYSGSLGGWAMTASGNGNYFASTCPLSLNTYGVVGVASGCTLSVLSSIGGTGGFLKVSPGTLKFAAGSANTYLGTTTVSDGTLDLNNGTIIPSATYLSIAGPLVIGNTNFAYSPKVRLLLDHQIANTTPITIHENGQLWLNGHDDTIGSLTLLNGAQVSTGVGGGVSSPGLLTLNGNVTNLDSALSSYARLDGRIDLGAATRTFNVEDWLRMSANISGSGGITKVGYGYLTFEQSTNSYSGTTLVQEGVLHLFEGASPLGGTGNGTTVAAYAELYVEEANLGAEPLTLNGSGDTRVMSFRGSNVCSGPVTLNNSCRLHNSDWGDSDDPDLNFSGVISGAGSLHKTGNGILHFTGLGGNTFTGGFYCEEGWAYLSKTASAPALSGPLVIGRVGEDAQWIFVEITQINQIPNSLPITLLDHGSLSTETGITETLGPVDITGGVLYGAGGTITLSGDVTNHLSTNGVGYLTGDISLPSTRIIHCDAGSTLQSGGTLAGAGGVTKTGPGELLFGGAHTYSGATLIKEGTLKLEGAGRPGSTAGGTTAEANGALYLNGVNVTNESLVLYGGGTDSGVALVHHNTNIWNGPVEIHGGAAIKAEPVAKLSLISAISGDGGLTHFGDGTLVLTGSGDNTFDGPMTFRIGTLMLSKPGAFAAIPNSLTLGYSTNGAPGAIAKCTAANQFAPAFAAELFFNSVTVNPNSTLDCNGFEQAVPNLYLNHGTANSGAAALTVNGALSAQPDNSGDSYVFGEVRLDSASYPNHTFTVASNVNLWAFADISESSGTQSIYKDGQGRMLTSGSNSFSGTLTIHQGLWAAAGVKPFGTPAGPTIVDAGASLYTYAGTFDEPLQLAGNGNGQYSALHTASTNKFTGLVTLQSDTTIFTETNGVMTLSGTIMGAGGFTKQGAGTLQFLGSAANTYAGPTFVTNGKLELGKTNVVAVPGPLTISGPNSSSLVRLLLSEQIADQSPVVLEDTGWIALEGKNETIGSLSGVGAVFQSGAQTGLLTVGGNGASTTFNGIIHGAGGLTKTGAGTFTLNGNNLYTGTTTVNGGTLLVFGQQPQSAVSILTGGRLGGTGRVGHLGDLNGHVSPGASPGILVCSNFSTFTPANLLQIELNGSTPGSGYDQLQVNGSVLLMGGTLQVAMNFSGAISNQYVIINNDGADSVSGTLTGLTEGASLTNNGASFVITYHGGDGNDVVLIQQSVGNSSLLTGGQWVGPGSFQLNGIGTANTTYSVEATSDLNTPVTWEYIGPATANGVGLIQFTDSHAGQYSMRFYRFRFP